jgi:hypothetical protein
LRLLNYQPQDAKHFERLNLYGLIPCSLLR